MSDDLVKRPSAEIIEALLSPDVCCPCKAFRAEAATRIQELEAEVERLRKIEAAVNSRDLFINPEILDYAANELDCCPGEPRGCEWVINDYSVGHSECDGISGDGYCPNDLAETLRAIAKVARQSLGDSNG